MNNATRCYLLSILLLSTSACKKDASATLASSGLCAPTSSYALPVTDLVGVINFNQTLQQYVISRAIPGTYDSVDIGVVCGDLPTDFKTPGTRVRFSGIYRGYGQNPAPPAAPAGTVYYYLEVATLAKL